MAISSSLPKLPEGLSFEIDELIMLRNWAENNALRLAMDLDHVENAREYEEFISLNTAKCRLPLATLWRTRQAIMVTPLGGDTLLFFSMSQALAAIHVRDDVIELRQDRVGGRSG